MRRSLAVDVDRLDALPDDGDGDGDADDDGSEEFFETLPQPQHLGRRQRKHFTPILYSD